MKLAVAGDTMSPEATTTLRCLESQPQDTAEQVAGENYDTQYEVADSNYVSTRECGFRALAPFLRERPAQIRSIASGFGHKSGAGGASGSASATL